MADQKQINFREGGFMDNPIDEIIAIDKAARKTVAEAEQKAKEILASAQE